MEKIMIFIDKYGAKYRTIKKANGLEIWNRNRGSIILTQTKKYDKLRMIKRYVLI